MVKQTSGRFSRIFLGGLLASGLIWCALAKAQGASDQQLIFELLNRIEQLEQEVRQLRGDLEVYRFRQENLSRRLDSLEPGTQSGVARSGQPPAETALPPPRGTPGSVPPSEPPRLPVTPSRPADTLSPPAGRPAAPPTAAASGSEQAAYDTSLNLLREGRFDEAIAGFQDFLRSYPDGRLAGNAQYWLGEAYYVTRDFDNAKEAFINMGVSYPDNEKLPDALLKLGNIYQELGDKAKAREVLQKLVQTYPGSQAAATAQKRLPSLR